MKITKKAFREYLNSQNITHKNNLYGNRKRPYGNYLYAQDRVLFDIYYADLQELGWDEYKNKYETT